MSASWRNKTTVAITRCNNFAAAEIIQAGCTGAKSSSLANRRNTGIGKDQHVLYQVQQRDKCRVCGSTRLFRYLTLPKLPLTDNLLSKDELGKEFCWPIDVSCCRDCLVSQTSHDVNVGQYYRDYQYTSGNSLFVKRFMKQLAEEIWRQYELRQADTVIEVGSGDGAQLACFQALGARVLGFEPSTTLCKASAERGVDVIESLFDTSLLDTTLLPAKVILAEYTFDHLAEPQLFLNEVKSLIDPRCGVLIIEVHDLEQILQRGECCLFQHEHTVYLTAGIMQRLLRRAGFVMLTDELLPRNVRRGNSLLLAAAVEGSVLAKRQAAVEVPLGRFAEVEWYQAASDRILSSLNRFRNYVRNAFQTGVRLAGYGAGGRGVMMAALAGKPNSFLYLCDKNPCFHGKYAPCSHIPIYGPQRLIDEHVQEVLVFSFGYLGEITCDLEPYVKKGGRLVSLLDVLQR
jgi:hypothetical protein